MSTNSNALDRLQRWYAAQCNGDWEHTYGIKIDTLDNPGWSLSLDLAETALEDRAFKSFASGIGEADKSSGPEWLVCRIEDHQFVAYGGPGKLDEMILHFLNWSEANP